MERDGREELARKHLELVDSLVKRELRKLGLGEQAREEMRSYALEGLATALERYDADRGVPFKAYAGIRIRWAIYDGLEHQGWFPRRLRRRINFYRRTEEMLRQRSAYPKPQDKVEAVHRMADSLKELATAYITTYAVEEGNEPAAVPAVAEESMDAKRFKKLIRLYVGSLPLKQRTVVREFFFEERKLTEIAASMGCTPSWVSKLLSTGLSRLRVALEGQEEITESARSSLP